MVITYYGLAAFKVQYSSTVLAFSPVSKQSKHKSSTFGADLALLGMNDPDFNGREQVAFGSKDPFVIDGPGEYEVDGIYVRGFGVPQAKKISQGTEGSAETRINTIYSVLFEGVNLCHMGGLDRKELDPEVTESLGEIDVLFMPLLGEGSLDPSSAAKMATALNPKLVIPMYAGHGEDSAKALSLFLKESGNGSVKPSDRLTLRKKDLEDKQGEVVIIEPSA